jgi:putative oxidoreductase
MQAATPRQNGALANHRGDIALALLRLASASTFLYHGSAILFGAFDGPGPREFATSHGWAPALGYLVGLAQVFGGTAMLVGILARLGAACLIAVMIGAIILVHLPHGFDVSSGGVEYAGTQLLIAAPSSWSDRAGTQ